MEIQQLAKLRRDADVHDHQRCDADRQENPEEQAIDSVGKSLPLFPLNVGQRRSTTIGCEVGGTPRACRGPRGRVPGTSPSRPGCRRLDRGQRPPCSAVDRTPSVAVRRRRRGSWSDEKQTPDEVRDWLRRVLAQVDVRYYDGHDERNGHHQHCQPEQHTYVRHNCRSQ